MTKRLVALLVFAFVIAVEASFALHRLVFDTQRVLAPTK
jgi:hypothetical protein